MSFKEYHPVVEIGDTCILKVGVSEYSYVYIDEGLTNKFTCHKGLFTAKLLLGKSYGTMVKSLRFDDGYSSGFATLLYPTAELWSKALKHRTQIIYTPDISMISMYLDLKPGSTVIEAGTGSGSLSHAIARSILPNGHLHTFDFHADRAETARIEFQRHSLGDIITSRHRDVCENGFGVETPVDALFLDLPSPWLAMDHVYKSLKNGGRFCSFSPCIEQVQRTCDELRRLGFSELYTIESLRREFKVSEVPSKKLKFDQWCDHSSTSNVNKNEVDTLQDGEGKGKRTNNERNGEDNNETITASKPDHDMKGHTAYLTFATLWK